MTPRKSFFHPYSNCFTDNGCRQNLEDIEGMGNWLGCYEWDGYGQEFAPSAVIYPAEGKEIL